MSLAVYIKKDLVKPVALVMILFGIVYGIPVFILWLFPFIHQLGTQFFGISPHQPGPAFWISLGAMLLAFPSGIIAYLTKKINHLLVFLSITFIGVGFLGVSMIYFSAEILLQKLIC